MTEAQLGAAMKAHALAEGKIGRLPPRLQGNQQHMGREEKRKETERRILAEAKDGRTHAQIAAAAGVSRGRVTQVLGARNDHA